MLRERYRESPFINREDFNATKYPRAYVYLYMNFCFSLQSPSRRKFQPLERPRRFAFTIEDVVFTGSTLQVSLGKSSLT